MCHGADSHEQQGAKSPHYPSQRCQPCCGGGQRAEGRFNKWQDSRYGRLQRKYQFRRHPDTHPIGQREAVNLFFIPIIGPELLKVETDSGSRLLYDWLAEKLAAKLNVDTARLPQPYSLNDVVCWHAASRGRREVAYTRLRSILREATFAPPIALKQLAEITDLDLFVSTTFDGYFIWNKPSMKRALGAHSPPR